MKWEYLVLHVERDKWEHVKVGSVGAYQATDAEAVLNTLGALEWETVGCTPGGSVILKRPVNIPDPDLTPA